MLEVGLLSELMLQGCDCLLMCSRQLGQAAVHWLSELLHITR